MALEERPNSFEGVYEYFGIITSGLMKRIENLNARIKILEKKKRERKGNE